MNGQTARIAKLQSGNSAAAPAAWQHRPPPVSFQDRSQSKRRLGWCNAECTSSGSEERAQAAVASNSGVPAAPASAAAAGNSRRQLLAAGGLLAASQLLGGSTGAAAAAAPPVPIADLGSGGMSKPLRELVAAAKPAWPAATGVDLPNYARPGPFSPVRLPPLEHTCASCFPMCADNRCLVRLQVVYPRGGTTVGLKVGRLAAGEAGGMGNAWTAGGGGGLRDAPDALWVSRVARTVACAPFQPPSKLLRAVPPMPPRCLGSVPPSAAALPAGHHHRRLPCGLRPVHELR